MMVSKSRTEMLQGLVLFASGFMSLLFLAGCSGGAKAALGNGVSTTVPGGPPAFLVYDSMYYTGKPTTPTSEAGMVSSNILYENTIWPGGAATETTLPARSTFDALIASKTNVGPLVLDIELLGIGSQQNEQILATLADWVHQDLPGKPVGFYGYNTLTNVSSANLTYAEQLAQHVDIMIPPMYTYDTDQTAWATLAATEAAEARSIAPGKPVDFFLWPQYHQGTPMAGDYLTPDYWTFELQTSKSIADNVFIWSQSGVPWDDSNGWWDATQAFIATLPK